MKATVRERILRKIVEDADTGCWNWQGYRDPCGYGRMGIGKRTSVLAYRAAWDAWDNPPIPEGHELHHVCENKGCCNPTHLQCVSKREHLVELSPNNIAFKAAAQTHCAYGHLLPINHTKQSNGKRQRICRQCANRRVKEFYQRNPDKYRKHIRYGTELRRKRKAARTHNTA